MSGRANALAEGWKLIRQKIRMEDPTPVGKYLGCDHKIFHGTMPAGGTPRFEPKADETPQPKNSKAGGARVPVTLMEYDMKSFLVSCVDKYVELGKINKNTLKAVDTPFLEESKFPGVGEVEPTPASGGDNTPRDGALKPIASRILMKILYAARMCRFDLLRATCALARHVSKWTPLQDRMLHRLMCYINCSLELKLHGWIGDPPAELTLTLYADADFAGDNETMRSTSGVFLALTGKNTFWPLTAISKRQSCVSHSTPEAEIVAADLAIRTEGLPALDLWSTLLKNPDLTVHFAEDNQACIQVINTG